MPPVKKKPKRLIEPLSPTVQQSSPSSITVRSYADFQSTETPDAVAVLDSCDIQQLSTMARECSQDNQQIWSKAAISPHQQVLAGLVSAPKDERGYDLVMLEQLHGKLTLLESLQGRKDLDQEAVALGLSQVNGDINDIYSKYQARSFLGLGGLAISLVKQKLSK